MLPQADFPIVIGYDHSVKARGAIECAGRLFPGRRAIIVCIWGLSLELRAVFGLAAPIIYDEARARRHAEETAAEGCRLAQAVGLNAVAETLHARDDDPARVLAAFGDTRYAGALALGAFEHGGLPAALHASFPERVLDRAHRAVLIVPLAETCDVEDSDVRTPSL
jgi:nucleotide-binding universal stress UspA family protein